MDSSGVVTAKEFRIVNDQGVSVASITEEDGHGVIFLSDGSRLPNGKAAIKVIVSADPKGARLTIFNSAGKGVADISADKDGSGQGVVRSASGDDWGFLTPEPSR